MIRKKVNNIIPTSYKYNSIIDLLYDKKLLSLYYQWVYDFTNISKVIPIDIFSNNPLCLNQYYTSSILMTNKKLLFTENITYLNMYNYLSSINNACLSKIQNIQTIVNDIVSIDNDVTNTKDDLLNIDNYRNLYENIMRSDYLLYTNYKDITYNIFKNINSYYVSDNFVTFTIPVILIIIDQYKNLDNLIYNTTILLRLSSNLTFNIRRPYQISNMWFEHDDVQYSIMTWQRYKLIHNVHKGELIETSPINTFDLNRYDFTYKNNRVHSIKKINNLIRYMLMYRLNNLALYNTLNYSFDSNKLNILINSFQLPSLSTNVIVNNVKGSFKFYQQYRNNINNESIYLLINNNGTKTYYDADYQRLYNYYIKFLFTNDNNEFEFEYLIIPTFFNYYTLVN